MTNAFTGKLFSYLKRSKLQSLISFNIINMTQLPVTNGTNGTNGNFKSVSHVIFDMDGLLLDSPGCYRKIDAVILSKYGKKVPENLSLLLTGLTDPECAKKIVETSNLPLSPKEYEQEIDNHTYLLRDVELLPGAERLIKHLAANNVPIAIATNSSGRSVDEKIHNHKQLFNLFSHTVMGNDPEVKNGKPSPDIFLVCASRFPDKPKPEQCLVFEDSPGGIIAAKTAGMQSVLVPHKKLEEERRKNATLVINSLADFKPEEFGLPPFN